MNIVKILEKYNLQQFVTFVKYCIVWVSWTIIDIWLLYILVEYAHINTYLAISISFLAAVLNNFLLNKIRTFQDKRKNYIKQYIKFFMVSVVWYLFTMFFMFVFIEIILMWYILAKVLTSVIVLTWNFLSNKFRTFKKPVNVNLDYKIQDNYKYDLSVVIPAFNEENRIKSTLLLINDFIKDNKIKSEIIVVNDWSTDNTLQVLEKLKKSINNLKIVDYWENKWKWYAVKSWIKASKWKLILFTDADNSTPIEEYYNLKNELFNNRAHIAIWSRYLKDSNVKKKQSIFRRAIWRIWNYIIKIVIIDWIKDTQCWFKLFYNCVAQEIFEKQIINRWWFDIELLIIAQINGFKIIEVPVSWYNSVESRLRPFQAVFSTLIELIIIKLNVRMKRYY